MEHRLAYVWHELEVTYFAICLSLPTHTRYDAILPQDLVLEKAPPQQAARPKMP
jgi:hypothetical protein